MSTPPILWSRAVGAIPLGDHEVHVWLASTDPPPLSISRLWGWLSDDEQTQACRFHFLRHRHGYIASHGILKYLIAGYCGLVEPQQVALLKGPRGKPYLKTGSHCSPLWFNQADSNGITLYAFNRHNEIGIDIEHMRDVPDADDIAARTFSEAEKAAYFSLPVKDRKEAFFNCWTRKEAFIKAIGEGLYFPLDQFDVTLKPDEPARLLRVAGRPEPASTWFMVDFTPLTGYKAALALPRRGCTVSFLRFDAHDRATDYRIPSNR